ncbi:MAG: acyl-CoA thioesterase [Streptosporangiaceae bacterium]
MRETLVNTPGSLAGHAQAAQDQSSREAGSGAGASPADAQCPPGAGFSWPARVFFDDLDAMGMLHNARYLVLLERASSAFFEARGWRWERDPALNPDQHYVVREQTIRYLDPIPGPGEVTVEMRVARLGETSVTLAFEVRSADGRRVHATAERVHVKLDPVTFRPVPWTPRLRAQLAALAGPASQASPPESGRGPLLPVSPAGRPA